MLLNKHYYRAGLIVTINIAVYAENIVPVLGLLLLEDSIDVECDDFFDADNDLLINCIESNTGAYVSETDTGTDPFNH